MLFWLFFWPFFWSWGKATPYRGDDALWVPTSPCRVRAVHPTGTSEWSWLLVGDRIRTLSPGAHVEVA